MDFKQLAAQYKNELFEKVLPFWLHRSQDFEQGGYYTCLNRRGEVLLPLKGGKWKGCFHVPRGLYQCWQILEQLKSNI